MICKNEIREETQIMIERMQRFCRQYKNPQWQEIGIAISRDFLGYSGISQPSRSELEKIELIKQFSQIYPHEVDCVLESIQIFYDHLKMVLENKKELF